MAEQYIKSVRNTEYKYFISAKNTYNTDKIYPTPVLNKKRNKIINGTSNVYTLTHTLINIITIANAIKLYPYVVNAVIPLERGKMILGNFTFNSIFLLSTSDDIDVFVIPENNVYVICPQSI